MKKRRVLYLAGVVLGGLLLAPFVVSLVAPWSEINCWHECINIKTGQVRYARYLWFITVSERVADTPLSLALDGETVDVADIEVWQRVNTFSPRTRCSPHYAFHSALAQADDLGMMESLFALTPQEKREIAENILAAWQLSGGDSGADEYIRGLFKAGLSATSP